MWTFTVDADWRKICSRTRDILFVGFIATVTAARMTLALGFGMAILETGGALNGLRDEGRNFIPDHV